MDNRIDNATQIAVGRVVHIKSVWDQEKKNIFTVYTFQGHAYLKQPTPFIYFDVIVMGGIIGDEAQIVTPSLSLQLDQIYLVFLQPTHHILANTTSSFQPTFELYSYVQGALSLKNGGFYDHFGGKPVSYIDMLRYIENKTDFLPYKPLSPISVPSSFGIQSDDTASRFRRTITLMDGNGIPTNTFYGGLVEDEYDMVIQGNGFGNTVGNIIFPNNDNGGIDFITFPKPSDIVYWTDTEIRVKIPQRAGSGPLQVLHSNGSMVGEQSINIEWSIKPMYSDYKNFTTSTRQFINFIDYNEEGGYTLHYNLSSGLAINEPAKAAFERALDNWRCATGVHFTMSSSFTNEEAVKDDISSILFQVAMPTGVVAMTTSRYKASGSTSCQLMNTTWYLREFDIQFAHPDNMIPGLSWSYAPSPAGTSEFDFETIALHELGHAHGLGHISDPSSSMYFAIENGIIKRELSSRDISAGLYQMEKSKAENCITSKLPMQEHPDYCGDQVAQAPTLQLRVLLEGFYQEETGLMRTELGAKGLLPLQQPFNKAPFQYTGTETLASIPPTMVDWLLISIRDTSNFETVLCEKAMILLSDGTVATVQEDPTLIFDCVEAGNYYISITHQNHLSVVSSSPLSLDATLHDFTTSAEQALGEAQLKVVNNKFFLYSGDFDCNGVINNEDYNLWKLNGASINVYSNADADGNGIINSLDYNLWKNNRSKIGMIKEH